MEISKEKIAEFCRRNHIRRLSLFGSVVRGDFRPESDVDVLVEFQPGHVPGFLRLSGMEDELSALFEGRPVDLVTEKFLNRRIRLKVLQEAKTQYAWAVSLAFSI